MRRTVVKEEEPIVRFSAPPQERESATETETPQKTSTESAQHEEKSAAKAARKPAGSRVLRGAIVLFSALGLFTVLVPTVTGLPLNEFLGSANFKTAYSGDNITFIRGSAALQMGNLSGATQALLQLQPESTEAVDLATPLFARLLESGDYANALRVCQHLPLASRTEKAATVNLNELGKSMGAKLGPEKAVALVETSSELSAHQKELIPAIFLAIVGLTPPQSAATQIVPDNVLQMEKLVPSLSGLSKTEAIKSIATVYRNMNRPTTAWEWSLKLPDTTERLELQKSIAGSGAGLKSGLLQTLGSGVEQDQLRLAALQAMVISQPAADAKQLLATIKTPAQRDLALKEMVQALNLQLPFEESVLYMEQITNPQLRLDCLVYLARQSPTSKAEKVILPKFTAFVRQHPEFLETHDAMLRYLVVSGSDPVTEQRLLNAMLDPKTRALSLEEWKAGKLIEATIPWGGKPYTIRQSPKNFPISWKTGKPAGNP